MKNGDITESEINSITKKCAPREQAFFTIMRQSGLPPQAIKQLRIGDVERILEPNPPIPCRIKAPDEKSPTFMGNEAVSYLRRYLRTRKNLTPQSLLFTKRNIPDKQINTKAVSRAFKLAAQKTAHQTRTDDMNKRVRLYSLIGFYRKRAKDYEAELGKSSSSKDDEFCRRVYEERAMPFLEIEPPTPMEIHQLETQNKELTQRLTEIEDKLLPKETPEDREAMKRLIEEHEEYERWFREHPEERKQWEEQQKRNEKWLEEHPEEAKRLEQEYNAMVEQDEKLYTGHLEDTVKELQNKLNELADIIKNHRKRRTKTRKTPS